MRGELEFQRFNQYTPREALHSSRCSRIAYLMSIYHVKFDPPTKVETARMNNKARCLFVRLTFPGLERPFRIQNRPTCFSALLSCCIPADSFSDDFEPTWSSLLKPQNPTVSPTSGDWISVQPSQKPGNGDIWLRISSNHLSIMLILCGPSPLVQEPETYGSGGQQDSLKSLSISDLQEQDREAYSDLFPTLYYYWDSGRLSRNIDPQRSSVAVTDRCICLMLAALKRGTGWSDGDIRVVQKSVPQEQAVEKRDFCWQESVREEPSSEKYIEVNYESTGNYPTKSPEVGDVISEEVVEEVVNRPSSLFPRRDDEQEYRLQITSDQNCSPKTLPNRIHNIDTWVEDTVPQIPVETVDRFTSPQPIRNQMNKSRSVDETRQKANLRQEVRRRRHEMLMQIFASSQPSTRTSATSEEHDILN